VQSVTLRAWVDYTNTTVVLGWLPLYAQVIRRSIALTTVFNGSAPTVSIGKAANPSYILGAQAVTSVGYDSIAGQYWDQQFEVVAEVIPDGSSAGRALVTVEYINGLVAS
jgi:hypothetical protein